MKKKLLAFVGILFVLIIVAALVVPYLFKDEIFQAVKNEANASLNAEVDFGDFGVTIFSSFPDFTLKMDDVSVQGIDSFAHVKMADIGTFTITVDLMSVFSGDYTINEVGLEDASLHFLILPSGSANWDIAKEDSTATETETTDDSPFSLALDHYYLENVNVIYDDRAGGTYSEVKAFDLDGSGDMTADKMTMALEMAAEELTVEYGGIAYLNHVEFAYKLDMDMDMVNSKYTFNENEMNLNGLSLGYDGWISMPAEDIDMDVTFETKQTEFKSFLSLVPAVYARDFESIQTSGKLAMNGYAKGKYNNNVMPGFGLTINVEDGMFKYPDLPGSAENIQINTNITSPGGADMDGMVLDVSKFHVDMAGQSVDAKLNVKTPESDPAIMCEVKSQLNLAKLQEVIPMEEGESYSGSITADLTMKGNYSTIEAERYDEFQAAGQVIVLDMDYKSPDLPATSIKKMYLNFSPQFVELSTFEGKIGNSDMTMDGRIDNLLAYYFKDEDLHGSFNFNSQLMDLNEFMEEDEEEVTEAEAEEEPYEVIEVPGNIDFTLNSDIKKLLYDNMEMTNVRGSVIIRDRTVWMENLRMNMLDGSMAMNGAYDTKNPASPHVDFDMDISQFDVQKSFNTFNTMKKLAPVGEHCVGKFSTAVKLNCDLDDAMEPVMNSLNGAGDLTTHNVIVKNSTTFNKLANVLKMDQYKELTLDNVEIAYEFKDGGIQVEPFDFKVGNGDAVMAGSNSFDQSINYVMNLSMPSGEMGQAAMGVVNNLVSQANAAGGNLSVGDNVKLDVLIGGTWLDPKITPKYRTGDGTTIEDVKEQIKEEVEQRVKDVKEDVKEQVSKEAEKLIADAEKQAKKLRAEAKKQADNVRKEGYAAAKRVEDEAKNPIAKVAAKKTADKMRKEADAKANKIEKEADTKANKLIAEAKKKADALK